MKLRKLKDSRGFTPIEITIAVGIIILLVSLSVHGLMRARVNANDSAVTRNIQILAGALESYAFANSHYPDSFDLLVNDSPPYISDEFSDGIYEGYIFTIFLRDVGGYEEYYLFAQPENYPTTGTKFVVYDHSGLQRFDDYDSALAYFSN